MSLLRTCVNRDVSANLTMKQPILHIPVLLIGLFFSCKNQNNKTDPVDIPKQESPIVTLDSATNDDYLIINSSLVHLVNPGPPGFELSFGYDNFDYKKQDINIPSDELDSLYFTPYLVTLKDSIKIRVEPYDQKDKTAKIKDADYKELVNQLFTHEFQATTIDLNRINNTSIYILKAIEPDENPKLEIGEKIISYSRIVYNADKTKASFYFENYCAGLCAIGQVVIMEKVDGIWKIKDTITNWVA